MGDNKGLQIHVFSKGKQRRKKALIARYHSHYVYGWGGGGNLANTNIMGNGKRSRDGPRSVCVCLDLNVELTCMAMR